MIKQQTAKHLTQENMSSVKFTTVFKKNDFIHLSL